MPTGIGLEMAKCFLEGSLYDFTHEGLVARPQAPAQVLVDRADMAVNQPDERFFITLYHARRQFLVLFVGGCTSFLSPRLSISDCFHLLLGGPDGYIMLQSYSGYR